jgi:sulfatase maturation enzyme AslB (radical SAM superfamily)
MVNFPTRLHNNSISAIDTIFIYYSRQENYELAPIYNSLSDHDSQLISIQDVNLYAQTYNIQNKGKINKFSLAEFNSNLSFVTWEGIFDDNDVDSMFSSFRNTF